MQFEDRVQAVVDFGFTRRQARFLVTVMLHSGVCLQRHYTAFAGIVQGQKTRKFFAKLVRRRYARAFRCKHNRARVYQVHSKALYRAIGQTDSRHRRPLSPARVVHGLMLLDAVLADPQLVWLATDDEKAVHLTTLTRIEPDRLPSAGIGKPPAGMGRAPFEKFPIGIDLSGRAVLVYLATDSELGRFCAFLQRHFEVLRSLPAWTLRIVAPPWPIGLGAPHAKTAQDDLTRTLRPALMDELRDYFKERRKVAEGGYEPRDQEHFDRCEQAFKMPRYQLLYRRWRTGGDGVFDYVSEGLTTALESGAGRIETVVLAHQYRHLSPLVSSTTKAPKGAEKGEETIAAPRPLIDMRLVSRLPLPNQSINRSNSTFEAIAP
jgi:hypothetical protein